MPSYKEEISAKKRKKFILGFSFFILAIIVLVAGTSYLLFFAKLFNIRTVNVDAPDSLRADLASYTEEWLNSGLWQFIRRNNILFASTGALEEKSMEQFPEAEFIKISRDFPHELRVRATERKFTGIWCLAGGAQQEKSKCFYFDQNAVAFAEAQASKGFLIMNIFDNRPAELKLGERVVSQSWFDNIMKIRELFRRMDIGIAHIVVPADSVDEFDVVVAEGWKIMFSNKTDIEKQVNSLSGFLKQKISQERRAQLQYVDLRIQDRIYYK